MLCPICGEEVTGKYCCHCGAFLDAVDSNTVPPENSSDKISTVSDRNGNQKRNIDMPEQEIIYQTLTTQVTEKKPASKKKTSGAPVKSSSKNAKSAPRQTVKQKKKVKKKKRRNLLSTAGSVTTGSVRSIWKIFIFAIQWICSIFMLISTFWLFKGFWISKNALGSISGVLKERNYPQALFLALALCIVGFGILQIFWMLSRKKMPDQGKIRRIDMGRGFFGFSVFVILYLISVYINPLIPVSPALLTGLKQIFAVIAGLGKSFFMINVLGIIFCIIRKVGTR